MRYVTTLHLRMASLFSLLKFEKIENAIGAAGKHARTHTHAKVALMRHQLKTVASAARSGPAKYASMVSNVVDIPKPQEAFREEIDNSRETPFVPRLKEKPNSVTPLDLAPVSGLMGWGAWSLFFLPY